MPNEPTEKSACLPPVARGAMAVGGWVMAGEWLDTTLGETLVLQRGFDLPVGDRSGGRIPVVASTGVVGYHNTGMVKAPGVVIGRSGSIGGGQYITTDFWPLNTTLWVKDFRSNNPRFCYYLLRSIDFNAFNVGSGVPTLNRNHVGHLPVFLPPPAEQKSIEHILGTLDDKIELNRKMNETLEAMAQALFKSWFIDFDPVRRNAARAQNQPSSLALLPGGEGESSPRPLGEDLGEEKSSPRPLGEDLGEGFINYDKLFPSSFQPSELGPIPSGWAPVKFENLVDAKQGRYLAKNEMLEKPDETHKYPVWGGNGILGYSRKKAYDKPITLMTCRGSNCGLIKSTKSSAWISNNSFACPTKFGSEYFLYLYFLNENFSECVSGSAQPQITYTALKNKLMKFPLSREICEVFSESVQVYRDKQSANEDQNGTLTKLRDTLLPKLISGELRIEDAEKMVGEAL